jgi:hypothetical protein
MSELPNFDCRISIARKKSKMPDVAQSSRHPARVVSLIGFSVKLAPPNTPLKRP